MSQIQSKPSTDLSANLRTSVSEDNKDLKSAIFDSIKTTKESTRKLNEIKPRMAKAAQEMEESIGNIREEVLGQKN